MQFPAQPVPPPRQALSSALVWPALRRRRRALADRGPSAQPDRLRPEPAQSQHRAVSETPMTAPALDSRICRDIFSAAEMRQVFSDEARTGYYLEIEAALARAQARLGVIPRKAAEEIVRRCRIENGELARLKQQTERIR